MRFLLSFWCPICLGLAFAGAVLWHPAKENNSSMPLPFPYRENEEWMAPGDDELPAGTEGDRIRYGRELVTNTAVYLGPQGVIAPITNGMNCQNCHLQAGTQNFANPFSGVLHNYPRYRDRSGRVESVEFRVNECLQRSLNGHPLDSLNPEMRAIVSYVRWVGKNVPAGVKPLGMGAGSLHLLDRAADPEKGKIIYINYCASCHGDDGGGLAAADSMRYTYPPLWGGHSFNISAGMLRLSSMAGFIRNNMPFGASWKSPQLTEEQAWDVAAWISAQQRPDRTFAYDWQDISKKPYDFPFGPYADSYTALQHRYGPFRALIK